MPRYLLKRNFNTPLGRFRKSVDGEPVHIPQKVVRRYGVPRDAQEVGDDYKTPAQIAAEEGPTDLTPDMSVAEIEAEIEARVNERIADIEAERRQAENEKTAARAEEAADAEDAKDDENNGSEGEPDEDETDEGEKGEASEEAEEDDILEQPVKDIVPQLKEMEYDDLEQLLLREQADKNRSTLVIEIEAQMEEFDD